MRLPSARALTRFILLCCALPSAGAQVACSGVPAGFHRVRPTTLNVAQPQVEEAYLLDVGVSTSELEELSEREMTKLGTNEDIRMSEQHYVPFHLKNTLQMSSQWGVVRVVPPEHAAADLRVTSRLYRSNGEKLQVQVIARDGSGRVWLDRKYHADAQPQSYTGTTAGNQEAYQDLYNTIANELTDFGRSLSPSDLEQIREVSRLRFAQDLAPKAYADYLSIDSKGQVTLRRLPSEDDPLMARIEKIREREALFIDTLNVYYEGFYLRMWEAYENWRRYNMTELVAMRKVKEEAFFRGLAGVLLIAAGVALGASDSSAAAGTAGGVLIVMGGQVVIDGFNVSEQAKIHSEAVEELGDSFGADMKPTVLELEGKQYELTGTVSEQFMEWRELLRRIYVEESGFGAEAGAESDDARLTPGG